ALPILLHGGASVVLAETLGTLGAMMHAGEGRVAVGIEINATHHRGATAGYVTGTATALSVGNTVATYAVIITDDEGNRVCTSRILPDPHASPTGLRASERAGQLMHSAFPGLGTVINVAAIVVGSL